MKFKPGDRVKFIYNALDEDNSGAKIGMEGTVQETIEDTVREVFGMDIIVNLDDLEDSAYEFKEDELELL